MNTDAPAFFQGMSPAHLAWVREVLEHRSLPAGTIICAEGDNAREMYVIESGHADVFIIDRNGIERLIAQLGPGATIGEMALFTGQQASASVRAATDLELLALSYTDFERVATMIPRIYQNLGTILSQRLVRANRSAVVEEHGRTTLLLDHGAPPLLGYALACSLAWHTRRAILLIVISDQATAELANLASSIDYHEIIHGSAVPTRRANMLIVPPTNDFAPATLPATIAELTRRYDYLLIQSQVPLPNEFADRTLQLLPAATQPTGSGRAGHTLHAWVETTSRRPDSNGVLSVPALNQADQAALAQGLLPSTTPAGKALGWIARDIARLKVGLALGAGSVKGYAHFGVLRALEQIGLTVDYLSGTSIGGIIATMHAMGFSADDAARVMTETSGRAFRLGIPRSGLLSNSGVRMNFRDIAGERLFSDLPIPLAIVTADLVTGREVVLRQGLLRTAVLATMSIPGIYPPVTVGDMVLVDGGVINPVPADAAAELGADVVLAVSLGNWQAPALAEVEAIENNRRTPGIFQVIMRSIEIMQSKIETSGVVAGTIVIAPQFEGMASLGLRSFPEGKRYITLGEDAIKQARSRITAALPWVR